MTDRDTEKIVVLGLGVSGLAAAELAALRGADVTVLDSSSSEALEERAELLRERGLTVHLDWNDTVWSGRSDLAIISPGIPSDSLIGQLSDGLGCPVVSELEYGFRNCFCPVVAVTGTNGKTTTVDILTHCMRHSGRNVISAGNNGHPLCEAVRRSADCEMIVLEVSSFQLEHIQTFKPLAGAVLNITPDHLDRYESFRDYMREKLKLLRRIPNSDRIVLRQDVFEMPEVKEALPDDGKSPLTFGASENLFTSYFLSDDMMLSHRTGSGVERLIERSELKLDGLHNIENALAALALGEASGSDVLELSGHLRTFVPGAHRLDLVTVKENLRFVNDSKATNVDAMIRGITATAEKADNKILLIAGGLDKGMEFFSVRPLLEEHVAGVFLIGRCRERLAEQWQDVVSCKMFVSLAAAFDAAVDQATAGDTVLLCPGCASQDMFTDYAERGREFCTLVKRRTGE